ncbi:MAG: TetR/AcrR family transcriptional regulator [Ardenticatenaceae bacterium]
MTEQKVDRRVLRTRRLLKEALISLILEKKYERITVQEILDRADIGRSTFYAHYRDKDDLLIAGMPENLSIFGADESDMLLPPTTGLFQHAQENYHLFNAMIGSEGIALVLKTVRKKLSQDWQTRIEHIQTTQKNIPLPAPVVAHYLSGAFMSLLTWWLDAKMPYPPAEMNHMFHELAMRGLNQRL